MNKIVRNKSVRNSNQLLEYDVGLLINSLASGNSVICKELIPNTVSIYKNIFNSENLATLLIDLHQYDDYTYSHSVNVAFYAMLIGKWLHMQENKLLELVQAGLLHDIGKLKIPETILKRKGKLTESDFNIMKQHSSLGYEMLKNYNMIGQSVKEAVLMHHERTDGSGYPSAAKGDCIGEYSRIIAIADVYDAMTSERPYKKRSTPLEAFHMFSSIGKNEFDATIVKIFTLNISNHLSPA